MFDEYIIHLITQYISYADCATVILVFGRRFMVSFIDIPIYRLVDVPVERIMSIPKELHEKRGLKLYNNCDRRYYIHSILGMLCGEDCGDAYDIASKYVHEILPYREAPEIYLLNDIIREKIIRHPTINYSTIHIEDRPMFDYMVRYHLPYMRYNHGFMLSLVYAYPYSDIVMQKVSKVYEAIESKHIAVVYACAIMNVDYDDFYDVINDVNSHFPEFYDVHKELHQYFQVKIDRCRIR